MNDTIRMAPPLRATLTRFAVAGVTSLVVTFALLWIMQFLIATGKDVLTDGRDLRFVDFVRIKQDEVVNLDEDKPEKPPEPEQQPPDMPQPQMDSLDTSNTVNISFTRTGINLDLTRGNFAVADGDLLPIVKVAPIYPRRAQSRGLQGSCVVELTVTKNGTVRDARAIECTSPLFERASVNAAGKFKYKPRVVDGQEIEVPGVQNLIRFEIEG